MPHSNEIKGGHSKLAADKKDTHLFLSQNLMPTKKTYIARKYHKKYVSYPNFTLLQAPGGD